MGIVQNLSCYFYRIYNPCKKQGNISLKHKEEGSARILRDEEDRERIKAALKNYIHPLDPYGHPNVPVNIVPACM